ncbi:MAG: glycosyl transferase [Prochloron sp. SP5CPC1]|nr:glycosyl transferase [Candidatus Paraprochloron terpiosi SP5CPC1]
MKRDTVYIAITNHGFGHAVRAASVAQAIKELNPDLLLILVTTAPRWLLESYIEADFIHRPRAFDVGVIQKDSLTMDKAATLAAMSEIRERQEQIIASEADFIRTNDVGLVLADIPPLAAPIARAAGVPCWMMSNFGWDFIYGDWGEEWEEMADWISSCYGQCARLFRLPMYEPMKAFPQIIDTGLTGGTPKYKEAQLRADFNLTAPKEKTVLLTFGGFGLAEIPYENLAKFPNWQFITFDHRAPNLANLVKVTERKYRPVDFMPYCCRVVSKPGYSTFAESLRLGVPIVSLLREGFAESSLLIEGIRDRSSHQIITSSEFCQGDWDFLNQPLSPPRKTSPFPSNGTEFIAQTVVEYFQKL